MRLTDEERVALENIRDCAKDLATAINRAQEIGLDALEPEFTWIELNTAGEKRQRRIVSNVRVELGLDVETVLENDN